MALTNIEYGSLASSDVINKNFLYLDDRISNSAQNTSISISSILSNIATINSRLSEMAEDIKDNNLELNTKLDDYKTKTKKLVTLSTMVPNWNNCSTISSVSSYTAPSNGYVLIVPHYDSSGNIKVNNKTVVFKNRRNAYDNTSQLVAIPVLKGDKCVCTMTIFNAYFLPAKEMTVAGF